MIYALGRLIRQLWRKFLCVIFGHKLSSRYRGPYLHQGLSVWCNRKCGLLRKIN
jgi:hypothetical protein